MSQKAEDFEICSDSRLSAKGACSFARVSALVCFILLSALSALAQPRAGSAGSEQTAGPAPVNARMLENTNRDYRISEGDQIRIEVTDAPEISREYQVFASGEIELPILGVVKAKQLTCFELGRLIAKGLRDEEYLKSPNVVVSISKYQNHTYFIQGSVNRPGAYQLDGQPSLLTLLSLAGGLTENHGALIFLLRPRRSQLQASTENGASVPADTQTSAVQTNLPAVIPTQNDPNLQLNADYELIKVNLNALYKKGQFDENQRLEPGDIVNIPRADTFFVAGEVKAPGSFTLKDGTTLRQAITLAQGMTFKAKAAQGVIFREDPISGVRTEIKVDLNAVLNGKTDDIAVLANDVILVPNSRAKTIGGTLLTAFGVSSARLPMMR